MDRFKLLGCRHLLFILLLLLYKDASSAAEITTPVLAGQTFKIYTDSADNFDGAKAACVAGGGKLAIINNEEELKQITDTIITNGLRDRSFYIGMKRDIYANLWIDFSPLQFTNFSNDAGMRAFQACQGETMNLQCEDGKLIRIDFAHYGRTSTTSCSMNPDGPSEYSCVNPATHLNAMGLCNGRPSCSLTAEDATFSNVELESCDDEYLIVRHSCVQPISPPNDGYVTSDTVGSYYKTQNTSCGGNPYTRDYENEDNDVFNLLNSNVELVTEIQSHDNYATWGTTGRIISGNPSSNCLQLNTTQYVSCPGNYVCEKPKIPDTCVAIENGTLGWIDVDCSQTMDYICEFDDVQNVNLSCQLISSADTNILTCPDNFPVAVGCSCTCQRFYIIEDSTTCQCACSSNSSISATCCKHELVPSENPGLSHNSETHCYSKYTASGTELTCDDNYSVTACSSSNNDAALEPSDQRCSSASNVEMMAWCCRIGFQSKNLTLEDHFSEEVWGTVGKITWIASSTTTLACLQMCMKNPMCLVYKYEGGSCKISDQMWDIDENGQDTFRLRKTEIFRYSDVQRYMEFMPQEDIHQRDLNAVAIGNFTLETCVGSCIDEDQCDGIAWRDDGLCYTSYDNSTDCCELITVDIYNNVGIGPIREVEKLGEILHCVQVTGELSAVCSQGYQISSCICGDGTMPVHSANNCNCPDNGSGNQSSTAHCCTYSPVPKQECLPGSRFDDISNECALCEPGTFSGNMGPTCYKCPAGYYTSASGSFFCEPCPEDSVSSADYTSCNPCPIGYITAFPGDPVCTIVDCGEPPQYANLEMTLNGTEYLSVATYVCEDGYFLENGGGFSLCTCNGTWTGDNITCEEYDECISDPCHNNATCNDMLLGYNCSCIPGYNGTHCEMEIDECSSNPCVNGDCLDLLAEYFCNCTAGFTGLNCETDIDECVGVTCYNQGTCHDLINAYNCTCPLGITGEHCETNIDECASITCENDGTCIDGLNDFVCNCDLGYMGELCEIPIDCGEPPSVSNSTLQNQPNTSYNSLATYQCDDGFELANGNSLLRCDCNGTWSGDNFSCNSIDDCANVTCLNNGTCLDEHLYYTCLCPEGFTGLHCETEIDCGYPDELPNGTYHLTNNNTKYNAVVSFTCNAGFNMTNGTGHAICNCDSNWHGDPIYCEEIDECLSMPCLHDGTCTDLINDYSCACNHTYGDKNCQTDIIDECDSNPCMNNGTCTNLILRYSCNCLFGFTGIHCETEIDVTTVADLTTEGPTTDSATEAPVGGTDPATEAPISGTDPATEAPISGTDPATEAPVSGTLPASEGPSSGSHPASEGPTSAADPATDSPPGSATDSEPFIDSSTDLTTKNIPITTQTSTTTTVNPLSTTTVPMVNANTQVQCNTAPDYSNAQRENDGVIIGTLITYTCNVGYYYPDIGRVLEVECKSNGDWRPHTRECTVVECPILPLALGTRRSTEARSYDTIAEYSCLNGAAFNDDSKVRTIICEDNANWSGDVPACERVRCPAVSTNAEIIDHTVPPDPSERETVTLQCPDDLLFFNGLPTMTAQCLISGDWYPDNHQCNSGCPPPPMVGNARASVNTAWDSTVIKFTCKMGYRFPHTGVTEEYIQCLPDGNWNQTYIPACKEIVCPETPLVEFAVRSAVTALVGQTVTYTCNKDYWFEELESPKAVIKCWQNVTWEDPPPPCVEIHCGPIQQINFTDVIYTDDTPGDIVTFTCQGNKRFINGILSKYSNCTDQGQWEYIGDSCEGNRCDAPPEILHGTPDFVNATKTAVVTYTCDLGYMYPDQTHRKAISCDGVTDNLFWNDTLPDCEPIICPDLSPLPHIVLSVANHTYGITTNVSCEPGYKFYDSTWVKQLFCNQYSEWDVDITETPCKEIKCPAIRIKPYMYATSTNNSYLSKVTHYCDPGFEFSDKTWWKEAVCLENEAWSVDIPESCQTVTCSALPVWDSGYEEFNDTSDLSNTVHVVINYTCAQNYNFSDRSAFKVTKCMADGQWNPALAECIEGVRLHVVIPVEEAQSSTTIGSIAIAFCSIIFGGIILLDIATLGKEFHNMIALFKGSG